MSTLKVLSETIPIILKIFPIVPSGNIVVVTPAWELSQENSKFSNQTSLLNLFKSCFVGVVISRTPVTLLYDAVWIPRFEVYVDTPIKDVIVPPALTVGTIFAPNNGA